MKSQIAKRRSRAVELQEKLIENMIEMQKVYADVAIKFDTLSKEISNLLALFESAAKQFAEQTQTKVTEQKDKDFLEKIDKLLEQNKIIAKGLTLIEDRLSERSGAIQPVQQYQQQQQDYPAQNYPPTGNRPLPRF